MSSFKKILGGPAQGQWNGNYISPDFSPSVPRTDM